MAHPLPTMTSSRRKTWARPTIPARQTLVRSRFRNISEEYEPFFQASKIRRPASPNGDRYEAREAEHIREKSSLHRSSLFGAFLSLPASAAPAQRL